MNTSIKAIVTACCLISGGANAVASDKSKLVTIVTSADAQTQLMAMVLTLQSVKRGADAHILLCGPAGDMALKDAPESAVSPQKPKGMSPQGLMNTILERTGTTAEVCAIYLPNAGISESDLVNGVTAANPQVMAARLIADDTRILSF